MACWEGSATSPAVPMIIFPLGLSQDPESVKRVVNDENIR